MLLVQTVHREFFRHVEQVVLRVFPVNIFQVKAEGLSVAHSFRIAFAQQQGIVDLLAGAHQPIGQWLVQFLHGPLNVGSRKFVFRTGIAVTVQLAQLAPEDVFQQYMVSAAPLPFTVLGGNVGIAHGSEKFNSRFLAGADFEI